MAVNLSAFREVAESLSVSPLVALLISRVDVPPGWSHVPAQNCLVVLKRILNVGGPANILRHPTCVESLLETGAHNASHMGKDVISFLALLESVAPEIVDPLLRPRSCVALLAQLASSQSNLPATVRAQAAALISAASSGDRGGSAALAHVVESGAVDAVLDGARSGRGDVEERRRIMSSLRGMCEHADMWEVLRNGQIGHALLNGLKDVDAGVRCVACDALEALSHSGSDRKAHLRDSGRACSI